jgi:hypothetical protein
MISVANTVQEAGLVFTILNRGVLRIQFPIFTVEKLSYLRSNHTFKSWVPQEAEGSPWF